MPIVINNTTGGGSVPVGSGTYAARPASPSLGDGYLVTSGQRCGSYYECRTAGKWELISVAYGAAQPLCQWDAETLPVQSGKVLQSWRDLGLAGLALVKDAPYTAPSITTGSLGGMPAATFGSVFSRTNAVLRTTSGLGAPVEGQTAPRSVLLAASSLIAEAGEKPLCAVGATTNAGVALVTGAGGVASKLGISYGGSVYDMGVSRSGSGLHVILYTYDGTVERYYLNGSAAPNSPHTPTPPQGNISSNGSVFLGTRWALDQMVTSMHVHALAVWDTALSSTDATNINTLIAARFS